MNADTPADTPADFPVDSPVDSPADLPVDLPVDSPVDSPADLPVELDTSGRVCPAHRGASTERVKLGEGGGNGGFPGSDRVVLTGCLCAGFPASTVDTCTTLLLQKFCSRFSPKEVG